MPTSPLSSLLSQVELKQDESIPAEGHLLCDPGLGLYIDITKAEGAKCERCWNYRDGSGKRYDPSDFVRSLRGGGAVMGGPVRYLLLALLAGAIVAIDQATKLSIVQSMRLNESIPIVPNLFSLTYIRNPGAAFGLLAGSSDAFRMVFFGVTSLFALALLGTILFRLPKKDWMGQLSIAGNSWRGDRELDRSITVWRGD